MSVKSTEIAAFRAARKAVSPEILPEKIEKGILLKKCDILNQNCLTGGFLLGLCAASDGAANRSTAYSYGAQAAAKQTGARRGSGHFPVCACSPASFLHLFRA